MKVRNFLCVVSIISVLLTACSTSDVSQMQSVSTVTSMDLANVSIGESNLTVSETVPDGDGNYTEGIFELTGNFKNNKLTDGTLSLHCTNSDIAFPVTNEQIGFDNVSVTFSDGSKYDGQWNDGISGNGTLTFENGDSYVGEFKGGKMSGDGVYTWSNQAYYKGQWNEDKMDGEGLYSYTIDGNEYLFGVFKNNVPDGEVEYFWKNHRYTTVWVDGICTEISYN